MTVKTKLASNIGLARQTQSQNPDKTSSKFLLIPKPPKDGFKDFVQKMRT